MVRSLREERGRDRAAHGLARVRTLREVGEDLGARHPEHQARAVDDDLLDLDDLGARQPELGAQPSLAVGRQVNEVADPRRLEAFNRARA